MIVSKTVNGNEEDLTQKFTFTVTLSDQTLTGTFGDMVFENGVAEFELQHGQSKEARKLPAGLEYTVTESNNEGYTATMTGETGTIEDSATATAAFVNNRNDGSKGGLTVTKTVTGNSGDTAKDFTFTVTLDDTTVNGVYGDMTFTNGIATFTLRHGQSATANGLPAGVAYTVTESDNDGYAVSATGDTGMIPANDTAVAAFTNNRDGNTPPPGDTPGGNPGGSPGGGTPPTPINIEDEGVPLASVPPQDMVTILDEDIPLSAVPMTGDEKPVGAAALLALLAAGMMGAFGYAGFKKKEDSE